MSREAIKLYSERKEGRGQSFSWLLKSYLPSLLIFFITLVLVFALIFVSSMSKAIDRTLQLLGSGSAVSYSPVDSALLPFGTVVSEVESTGALVYSKNHNTLVNVKGIDSDYFTAEKEDVLKMSWCENDTTLKGVVLSQLIASKLEVRLGDRVAMLLYDRSLDRTRPVYLFIEGIYSSGYNEFDESLVFTDIELVDGIVSYEILSSLPADELLTLLEESGVEAISYKELYRSIYDNINLSVSMLNLIVVFVALLSGFFALSVSIEYVQRDKKDIAGMLLIGFSREDVLRSYIRITMSAVFAAVVLALLGGIGLSYLVQPVLSSLDVISFPALQNYVLSFEVSIPFGMLLLLVASTCLTSYLSLRFSLKKYVFTSLKEALVS